MQKNLLLKLLPVVVAALVAGFGIQSWLLFRMHRELHGPVPPAKPRPGTETSSSSVAPSPGYQAGRRTSPGFSPPQPTAPPQARSPAAPLWSVDGWNPFEEMERMREEMDAMFGRMLGGMNRRSEFDAFSRTAMPRQPRMDVKETDLAYILTLEFPGAGHTEIETEVRSGILHVSARIRQTREDQTSPHGRLTHIERHESRFQRTIPLPPDADHDQMSTEYADGVFRITLPRRGPTARDTV